MADARGAHQQGPIPVEEALRIARQIAEALSEAHEKGIIHRDLKPANVKLTPEGQVKVLDFGLAKAFSGDTTEAGASSELSQSPTLSRQATAVGLILGTAAYMSPEQAKGKKVDRRTDVWAFGVVLYEMLTGTRLFDGEDVSDTLAAVLRAEPDWGALPAETPSAIRRLLRRALTKDRRERLGDIGDARLEIEEADGSPPANVVDPSPSRRLPLTVTGPLLFAFGAVLAWSLARPDAGAPPTVTRYSITLPDTVALDFNAGLAWSPDGKSLVYRANRDGVAQLFLRSRDQQDPIPIRATENGMSPFFSPDGQWIGFFDGESLKKVAVAGGPSVTLCPAGGRLGASWGPDDTIVFASNDAQGLMRVPAAGGEPTPLTDPAPDEGRHNWPEFLPDGRAVLFTISQQGPISDKQIAVLSLDSGETRILADGTDAGFASSGHLVFAREASLWAVAFDLESLDVTGTPAPVVEGVQVNSLGGWAGYALAADGSLAYRLGTVRSFGLDTVDRQGAATTLTDDRRNYGELRFSPDGRRVAVELEEDIWMLEVARGSLSRFTVEGGRDPVWTPDGTGVTPSMTTAFS